MLNQARQRVGRLPAQIRARAAGGFVLAVLMAVAAPQPTAASAAADQARRARGPGPPPKIFTLPRDHPLRLVSIETDPVYKDLLGMRADGWLGSDADESIVLSPTNTLWLFGDTFIGSLSNGVRVAGAPMVHSTIGMQDRRKAPPDCMTFYWKRQHGKPASFFPHQPHTPGEYYWVTKGALLEGELFLWAWCIGGDAQNPAGFKEYGSALIRVPNSGDPPDKWEQKAFTLTLAKGHSFHAALLVKPPYVYMYGVVQPRQTALARVKIADLRQGRLAEAFEYWVNTAEGPRWGAEATHCVPQFLPVNSECVVHQEPAWNLYTCLTYDAYGGPEIYLTTARELTGPWSKPQPVYSVPEHQSLPFPIISYAVRQHPQLSTKPGELVISYITNVPGSTVEHFTEAGKDLYVTRFLRAQFELNQQ